MIRQRKKKLVKDGVMLLQIINKKQKLEVDGELVHQVATKRLVVGAMIIKKIQKKIMSNPLYLC